MSTSFSGSLPLLSTLFVFYYTDFMANKICMYVTLWQYSDRDLLTGGVECRGINNCDVRTIALFRK